MLSKLKKASIAFAVLVVVGSAIAVSNKNQESPKEENVVVSVTTTTVKEEKVTGKINLPILNVRVDGEQVIEILGGIDGMSVALAIQGLEQARKSNIQEVYLLIDSPGGSVVDGAKLIGYMKSSSMKINTVCIGICASMGAQIHQAGKKRFMADKTILMFHQASGGVQGTIEQMDSQIKTFKLYVDRFDAEVAERVGIPYNKFKADLANEIWVEARDAVIQNYSDGLINIVYDKGTSFYIQSIDEEKQTDKNEKTDIPNIIW